jgi:high-affinity nickel permease
MNALLSIIALGFSLGMRHAADPDDLNAVTTIVARHLSFAKILSALGAKLQAAGGL